MYEKLKKKKYIPPVKILELCFFFLQLPPLPGIAGELLNNKVFLPFFHKKSKNQVLHLTIFAFFSYFITENSMRKYQ